MCNPTLFMAGAGGVTAASQISAGNYADDISKRNQVALNQQAESVIEAGKVEEGRSRIQTADIKGKQKTGFAASGVDVGSGSPVDILSDTAAFGELDALTIRQGAEADAESLRSRGVSERLQGKLAKRQGYGNAAGTLLTTGSSIARL